MSTLTIIISGGRGTALSVLTDRRAIPAVPLGGIYRLVDFTLANVAAAELGPVAMLAQSNSASLFAYLAKDGPWGARAAHPLDVSIWLASKERTGYEAYVGSADAVCQNSRTIRETGCDTLLLLPGDQIYRLDYQEMLRFHRAKGADLTIATKQVSQEEAHLFGTLAVDGDGRIEWFEEKVEKPRSTLASLAIYAVSTAVLLHCLDEDSRDPGSLRNLGRDIIPKLVAAGRAYAYPISGYWGAIDTLQAWWKVHMAFIDEEAAFTLCAFPKGARPAAAGDPPARLGSAGRAANSLVASGCVIEGEALHSVLSPGVRIEKGASVRDSVLLDGAVIRAGAVVDRCVLDARVEVGAGARLGSRDEDTPNRAEPDILYSGLTVAGEGARIPPSAVIGRNCRIDAGVTPVDFPGLVVPAGSTIHKS